MRRLSLQAAGGVAEEQEGEEAKPHEESVDSEQVTTETDGEEGTSFQATHSSLFVVEIFLNS